MRYKACKCVRCNEPLDRNVEPFVTVGKRWAHKQCEESYQKEVNSAKIVVAEARKESLEQYHEIMNFAKAHFNKPNYPLIQKQINEYTSRGYTISGILKSLIYYYDIKKNPCNKGAGGIGAVGICYEDAKNYYYKLYLSKLANEGKTIKIEKEVVTISPPERKVKPRKAFTFLEEEAKYE